MIDFRPLGIYRRVLTLLRPVQGLALTLTLANLALAAVPFVEPILFGRTVDLLTQAGTRGMAATVHDGVRLFGIWLAVGVGSIAVSAVVSLHADRLAHRLRLEVMAQFFAHVLRLHLAFHHGSHSGRLLSIMLQGGDQLFGLWLAMFRDHLSAFVSLLVLLPLTLLLNWKLAAVLIVLTTVSAAITAWVTHRTHSAQGQVQEQLTELAEQAGDTIGNVLLVQSFVRQATELRQLRQGIERLLAAQFPVLNWWAVVSVLSGAASTMTIISIFALGAWLNLRGEVTVGEIVTFMGFATHLIGRLGQVVGFTNSLFMQAPALAQFFEVLDTRSAVRELPAARPLSVVHGRVEFERVGFSYSPERKALEEISFVVAPGRTVALVGDTGAGKSTVMGLLLRQYDPAEGRVLIDGQDLRELTLDSLRANIGVVFQESLLFFRTIEDNLRVGRPEATEEEMIEAARQAQAHDFILRQPRGYKTRIGERGANLSGGERQRLAIARVLLKNPPILILDEATSALDSATEAKVQQALQALMRGRTTLVIAHRLATIRNADEILVFRQGRIVERGSFDQLAHGDGLFAQLVAAQQRLSG
ncbi:MAG: cyclic beta-1,2-glucan ABC transporter [Desulfobulbaceae bacterium A2]|nr:MAG: cyclic beta-1,2-glucan ABC transporter [Desulfobulbaceae bacterium A2]